MTPQKRLFKSVLATLIVLFCYSSITNAQTVAEMINNPDNSIVFRIENLDTENSPTKILLVYDSNLITLETTSVKSKMYYAKSSSGSTLERYSPAAALASNLAVEIEKDIELEDWMLEPFAATQSKSKYLITDSEDEMVLEEWMYDLNSW